MAWLPEILALVAVIGIIGSCYLKGILSLLKREKYDHLSTRVWVSMISVGILYAALSLSNINGYKSSFPKLSDGETATVLAVYDPNLVFDQVKTQQRKRCLVKLKDGRETIIDEDEFYHGEIQNIRVGDPIIKESGGPIYVLRQINIHRTIPQPPARKELESPLTEDFDKKESEKKTPD